MRKVQVNTQVRSTKEQRDATGCGMWLPKTFEGLFHEWGVNYEEFETGPGNFTVAIVELEDGTVDTFPAHQIKFIDKEGK